MMRLKTKLSNSKVKPFLKWAGGKGQLLDRLSLKYPLNNGLVTKYCEPFIGGGAVFFDIISKISFTEILINDINKELINTYRVIRDDVGTLVKLLNEYQNIFWNLGIDERKKFYYDLRGKFNTVKIDNLNAENIESAALLIFLNRTCFNGLYRVNSKGLFNVPMGDYKKPVICDSENLEHVSSILKKVDIKCGDYSNCFNFIDKNTFVYIDPPYRPLSTTSKFTAYSEQTFADSEQIRLGSFVDKISEIGAKVVLSNSDPRNIDVNDMFFDNLYRKHNIERITAKRVINSMKENRGLISEILVSNF